MKIFHSGLIKKSQISTYLLLIATFVLIVIGCKESEQPRATVPRPIQTVEEPANAPRTGPKKTPDQIASIHPDLREKRQTLPTSLPKPDIVYEPIKGYSVPAEYMIVPSKNYKGAVAVSLPQDYNSNPGQYYPLVIAFGGAGECARVPRDGALAWLHYYKADDAVSALGHNRLDSRDFKGFVSAKHLDYYNGLLARYPYKGIILACPSSPLPVRFQGPEMPEYEEYIMNELIPALKDRYRVSQGKIGVDGVSMGGARSMYYGLKYPEMFESIGSVQGAFGPYMDLYSYFVRNNRNLLKNRHIQLITSEMDGMLPSVSKMHALLKEHGIPHKYLVLKGPHDYIFNQGPGVLSLLVFHNRSLNY